MKRWTLRIVVCLVLGCVTTVAVAWGFVVWQTKLREVDENSRVGWVAVADAGPTVAQVQNRESFGQTEVDVLIGNLHEHDVLDWYEPLSVEACPTWMRSIFLARVEAATTAGGLPYAYVLSDAFGWPQRAMWCEPPEILWFGPLSTNATKSRGGIEIGQATFPLRPIWPGFVIDALFYGVIWFGIFFAFGSARRAVRRRRGRCPKCAYQLRGRFDAACSECGWNRPEDNT